MNERRFELTLALFTVLLGACAPPRGVPSEMATARSPGEAPVDESEPELGLEALEQRMLAASRVAFEFEIASEGSLISHLRGRVAWVRDGELTLVAEGEFIGQPQQLELRGDASTLTTIVGGRERWSGARPPELIDALVLGLLRMGLLHNLAVLVGGMPPDHAEGGTREWLETDQLVVGPAETREGVELRPLDFVVVVSGQPSARATLWLDSAGLAVERQVTVEFPEGEMRVVERYSNFVIEP